ncbi:MarR family winged helix-turn-helix transcriptional regulator [Anaerosporobacter faecicola]|uniref:MarR family winged helix-turn-helix transcriptional regulator n=1 Tax=Anaerosporobacter faecicola TaxID=2718714 RepID=UPI00143B05D8|nr:MarR family transcriptional regulator [Anaerosporobacter faecicola]
MKLEDSLGYLINQNAKLLKRQLTEKLTPYQVTPSHWSVLKVLSEEGPLTQVEIASRLGSDKATCGSVIDRLERNGFVERISTPGDRRSYHIQVTDLAQNSIEAMTAAAKSCNEQATAGFTKSELQQLNQYLRRIFHNLGGECL